MKLSKWIGLVTPKAYRKVIKKDFKMPEDFSDINFIPDHSIYMNMMGGWTEEECDNVAYIIPRDYYNDLRDLGLRFKTNTTERDERWTGIYSKPWLMDNMQRPTCKLPLIKMICRTLLTVRSGLMTLLRKIN